LDNGEEKHLIAQTRKRAGAKTLTATDIWIVRPTRRVLTEGGSAFPSRDKKRSSTLFEVPEALEKPTNWKRSIERGHGHI